LAVVLVFMLVACATSSSRNTNGIVQSVACITVVPDAVIITVVEPVMFDFDKSDIRADQEKVISKVVDLMNEYPEIMLVLEGHASIEGTDAYNLALSQRRADSVKDALVNAGIEAERIVNVVGEGETSIFGDILNTNRRVMVLSVE